MSGLKSVISGGDGSWRIYAHDGTAWKSAALT